MKNKNKGKVEYVEEFRKITALQKLPTLKQGFGDLYFQTKAQNTKFLRLKDQVPLNEIQLNTRLLQLCQNAYVHQYIADAENQCRKIFDGSIDCLNDEINYYKQWANDLTSFVEQGKYFYRFKQHRTSPPVALSKDMITFDPLALELSSDPVSRRTKNKNKQAQINVQTSNISLPNKQKKRFDFSEITDYLIADDYKQDQNDGNTDLAKKQIENFRPLKTIQQINEIQELKTDYEKFQYSALEIAHDHIEKKNKSSNQSADFMSSFVLKHNNSSFIEEELSNISIKKKKEIELPEILLPTKNHYQRFRHYSIKKNILDVNISYFRNIGPPSRHPEDFIKALVLQQNDSLILNQEENPLMRQKMDTCLLHFLQPSQLKVNKNTLSFYELDNISMSRIVSTNAPMCIRSQKVTRLQYEKLVKKMQKLYKMQHEDGKARVNQAISTEEFQQETGERKTKNDGSQKNLSIQKIVDEINAIRKQAYCLQNIPEQDRPFKFINQRLVKDEMSRKLFSLLQQLYRRVCEGLPFQYSILQIGLHVDEVNGLAESEYEKKKLIWFIMTVLEEIQRGKSLEKNISYLQNKIKKDDEPMVTRYKGEKVVARDKMGSKHLYFNNFAAATTAKDKSVTMRADANTKVTPSKTTHYHYDKTPLKSNTKIQTTPNKLTSKSPLKTTTPTQQKRNVTPTKDRSATNNNGSTAKKSFKF